MWKRVLCLVALIGCLVAQLAIAEWRVELESKAVVPGQTDVTVDLSISNDLSLSSLTVPIVVRETSISPIGAFWTGTLPAYCQGNEHDVTWFLDGNEGVIKEICTSYNGTSPDGFNLNVMPLNAAPEGRLLAQLTFDVTSIVGEFEFDTGCVSPGSCPIYMIDDSFPPVDHGPTGTSECTFGKGTITISDCDCTGLGDLDGNGWLDPLDVAYLVGVVYLGHDPAFPPLVYCPVPNGSWDCDDAITPLDVAYLIYRVYLGRMIEPCDPCIGGWLSDLTISPDDIYLNPALAEVGTEVGIWVNTRNIGMQTAVAPALHIYQGDPNSGGILIGSGNTIDIPPGGASGPYGGTFTFDQSGQFEIYGVADSPDLIVEYDEDNNAALKILEVIPPVAGQKLVLPVSQPEPIELYPQR